LKNKTDISEKIEKCSERLSRLCINLCRDHHDAADLFQDTCLRAIRYYKTYDEKQDFEKWIFIICVNTYKSTLRRLYRSRPLLFASNDEHDEFFNMIPDDDDTATHEEYKDLLKTVKRLPEKYRTVVVLRYFNDYSEKETAEILGIPTGTVKSRLNAAKVLIRKEMEHEE
jgi:RNA polymerase sigma-70 factor (ECF subfamily)